MNDCRKTHIWNSEECPYCKIQELEQEIKFLKSQAMGKTASERALDRIKNLKVEEHPSMKAMEEKFKNLK